MADKIIPRADAIAQGLKFYFTGQPCKHGHVALRRCPSGTCMACEAESDPAAARARANAWYKENRERALANVRAYYAANMDRLREEKKAYHRANRHINNAATRRYRLNHPEKCRAMGTAYKKANRDRVCAHSHTRRARARSVEGCYTPDDIKRIYRSQKGKCAYCKEKVGKNYHVDHITPLSKGGSNWPKNLQILCGPCNLTKGANDPLEHAQSLGLLL